MDNSQLSFEQILNATVRMLRTTWKAKICLFLQMDDSGNLRVRAADGLSLAKVASLTIKPAEGSFAVCLNKNEIIEANSNTSLGTLAKLLKPYIKKNEK